MKYKHPFWPLLNKFWRVDQKLNSKKKKKNESK